MVYLLICLCSLPFLSPVSEQVWEYRSFASLGRFLPRHFILFNTMVNGVVSLISFSGSSPRNFSLPFRSLISLGFPGGSDSIICRQYWKCGLNPWVGKRPWRRSWEPTPVFLPGESPWTRGAWLATVYGVQSSPLIFFR